jgi:F0F1-type ATP synthase membrane subunit a
MIAPLLADLNPLEHVMPQNIAPLFDLGKSHVTLTSHILMMGIAAVLMLLVFPAMAAAARKSPVPRGIGNFFEAIMSFLRTEVFRPALGDNTDRFVPFLWTLFFFILFCNLLGLIPTGEIIEIINGKFGTRIPHIGGTATANINVTAALALITFVVIHISGIWQQIRIQMDPSLAPHHSGPDHQPPHGHGGTFGAEGLENGDVVIDHHAGEPNHAHGLHPAPGGKPFAIAVPLGIGHYFKNLVPPVPLLLWPLMLVLELIGVFIKPFSLCMRLFANMVAGHLVLASLVGLIFLASAYSVRGGLGIGVIAACAAFSLLELFVAFLQAYIFTFLATLFIAAAVAPEH